MPFGNAENLADAVPLSQPDSQSGVLQLHVESIAGIDAMDRLSKPAQDRGLRIADRNTAERKLAVLDQRRLSGPCSIGDQKQ